MTDCNKREGLWQLSQRQSVRAFDNVAGLHLLIAKLLVHFHNLTDHRIPLCAITSSFSFFFYQCVSTPKPPPPPPSTSPASVRLCVCLKWIFYLAVKSSSVIYNSRPITLFPPTHGENESKSLPFRSRVNSSPAPPVIRIFCSKYQRKRFGDCVSCVLSSVSLN